jgi:endonuclease III
MKRAISKSRTSKPIATGKKPHNIAVIIRRLRRAVEPYAKAALFELAAEGFTSPFEQLVACNISIRTYDEVMLPTAGQLFARARTPLAISRLTPQTIDELIRTCTFHERKARQIHTIARRVVEDFNSELPCDAEVLLACGQPHIGVDIHVHRVTNR